MPNVASGTIGDPLRASLGDRLHVKREREQHKLGRLARRMQVEIPPAEEIRNWHSEKNAIEPPQPAANIDRRRVANPGEVYRYQKLKRKREESAEHHRTNEPILPAPEAMNSDEATKTLLREVDSTLPSAFMRDISRVRDDPRIAAFQRSASRVHE